MNILIVDDHAVVRRGARELLMEAFPDAAITEAATAEDALLTLESATWSLVILDIAMPGCSGLDALPEIHTSFPDTPILVLSGHTEEQYAIRALRAGAVGYVTKDSATEELVIAARKALAGGMYVTPRLAEHLARDARNALGRPLHETLSERELQVLRMLAAGQTVKQIGAELTLSDKTISTYRTRMLAKMDMKTNADLVRYAIRTGLVE